MESINSTARLQDQSYEQLTNAYLSQTSVHTKSNLDNVVGSLATCHPYLLTTEGGSVVFCDDVFSLLPVLRQYRQICQQRKILSPEQKYETGRKVPSQEVYGSSAQHNHADKAGVRNDSCGFPTCFSHLTFHASVCQIFKILRRQLSFFGVFFNFPNSNFVSTQ